MNMLERMVATVAPRWGLSRAVARAQLARLYDAAKPHHQHLSPTNSRRSGDGVMEHARDKVTNWARHMDENHDIVTGLLSTLALTVSRMTVEPMVRLRGGTLATVMNDRLSELWVRYRDDLDWNGGLDWSSLAHLAARTWFRDGEVFVNHLEGAGETIPYSVEILEPEFVPFDLTQDSPTIVHGVEKNAAGRPTAFYFFPSHPGNNEVIIRFKSPQLQDLTRVVAQNVSHCKLVKRLHQTRGISILHSTVHRLDDLQEYEASERVAARIAASISAFITAAPQWGSDVSVNSLSGERPFELDSGQIHDLQSGETVTVPNNPRPNTELMNFRRSMLRAVAAGTQTGASSISRDYADGSYSSQRQELVEQRPNNLHFCELWEAQFLRPIHQRFVRAAVLSGLVSTEGINPETLFDMHAYGVETPWIDPQKEVAADVAAINAGLKSRHGTIRQRGGNPREIDREREQDTQPGLMPMAPVNGDDNAENRNQSEA